MLGGIASNWETRTLAELLSEHYPGDWGEERGLHMAKVLRSTNLTREGRLDVADVAIRALSPLKASMLAPKQGDILLERSGGGPGQPVGRVGFVEDDMAGHAFSNFLHLIRPDAGKVNSRFLGWVLYQINQTGRIVRLEQQTTQMRNLNFRDYLTMQLPYPPPKEQAAIARVLDAVDTALERTRKAADRAGVLRLALLQSSFEFDGWQGPWKDTHAGRIPTNWNIANGRRAFVIVTGGCSSVDALRIPENDDQPDAWFMKVDDFNDPANRRAIVHTKIAFRASDNGPFKILPVGTVVIAKRGAAIMKNRVRTTAVPISLDPNLMAIQALAGMRPEFLRLQLEWRNLARYIENSGVPQLNNKDLYPRYFLRAPDSRQLEIVNTVAATEQVEDTLISKCVALEQLKKSLLHDLLTGKVRVGDMTAALAP